MSCRPALRRVAMFAGSLALLIAFSAGSSWAATRFSVATGAWASTAVWSATSGGAPGASAPIATDDAIIEGGFTVTLGANAAASNVTVRSNSTVDAATFTLAVTNIFTLQAGSTFKQGGTIQVQPGATRAFDPASTYVFNGTQTSISAPGTFGNLTWSAGNCTPGTNLTINGDLKVTANSLRG